MKKGNVHARDGPALAERRRSSWQMKGVNLQEMLEALTQGRELWIDDPEVLALWKALRKGADKEGKFTVHDEGTYKCSFVGPYLETVLFEENRFQDTKGLYQFSCPLCLEKTPVLYCEKEDERGSKETWWEIVHCGNIFEFSRG